MGGLFGGSVPPPPEPQEPALMPDDQSPAVLEAKRLQRAAALARHGRDSTLLSRPSDRASGGGDYSRATLGGA